MDSERKNNNDLWMESIIESEVAIESAVVEAQNMLSSYGGFLTMQI